MVIYHIFLAFKRHLLGMNWLHCVTRDVLSLSLYVGGPFTVMCKFAVRVLNSLPNKNKDKKSNSNVK